MRKQLFIGKSVRRILALLGVGLLAGSLMAFSPVISHMNSSHARVSSEPDEHPFTIVSPDFQDGGWLPLSSEFGGPGSQGSGCSGQNMAPTLKWFNVPAGTKGFAFTINDVDAPVAGGFHVDKLQGHGQNPYSEGTNSYGTIGYGGPCPPPDGQPHHYVFTVYALSVSQVSGEHITFEQLLQEIAPDVLGATSIIGKFKLESGS
jgi:phosphatidylethanolamine-binding protein (PEBP) family uncharacterized protein